MPKCIFILLTLFIPALAQANVVGTIDSVVVTSNSIDFPFSWDFSVWDGVTDSGMRIRAVEESQVSFASMVMDEVVRLQERERVLVSASGQFRLSEFPEVPDTQIGQLLVPARLTMHYRAINLDSRETSTWTTGVTTAVFSEENWVDAIATVGYSFDESRGAYNVGSIRVETVAIPEPGSMLIWGFGLVCVAIRRQSARANKTPTQ